MPIQVAITMFQIDNCTYKYTLCYILTSGDPSSYPDETAEKTMKLSTASEGHSVCQTAKCWNMGLKKKFFFRDGELALCPLFSSLEYLQDSLNCFFYKDFINSLS